MSACLCLSLLGLEASLQLRSHTPAAHWSNSTEWKWRTARTSEDQGDNMASTLNRSLERGMEILRAFRPGSALLGNSEIAERTGLSPATVSRLTQTLVVAGMLAHDRSARAYRLAAPVLSLAHAMRTG